MNAIVEGAYLRDILAQPAALDLTVAELEIGAPLRALVARLHAGRFRRVVLTGMGSSLFALYPLHLALTASGITSVWADSSEVIYYQPHLLEPETLVVAVSQSGRSAEIVRLLDLTAGRSPVIGVTNTPESPLGTQSDAVLLMHAGAESTVSCKTYVATLVVLEALGALMTGREEATTRRELAGAGPAAARYLTTWRAHAAEAAEIAEGARCLFYAGRGASLAAALTGGLITKESTHFPTEGMSTAAFRHGPMEMLGPETLVMIFEGDAHTQALNTGIVDEIHRLGHRAELIGPTARRASMRIQDVPASIRPVLEILPVQMMTLGLASIFGMEAGRFTLATKVTATE